MFYLACNDMKAFFTSTGHRRYKLWYCQNVCDALSYLSYNIYIRFGTKLYREIVSINSDGYKLCSTCSRLVFILL